MFLEAYVSDDDPEYIRGRLTEGLKMITNRSVISKGEERPLSLGIGITDIAAEYS